ncbi:MAG: DUF1573 domain-containing protein [Anaerolineales bacterium]
MLTKKTLIQLVTGLLILAACAPGQARIEVETLNFDFGEVVLGDTVWRDMQLTNAGTGELVIERIVGSCDCTRGAVNDTNLPAGASTNLRISFASAELYGEVVGPIIRSVYIYSNDPNQPELQIEFSGTIVRDSN